MGFACMGVACMHSYCELSSCKPLPSTPTTTPTTTNCRNSSNTPPHLHTPPPPPPQEVRDTFSDNGHPVQFADVKRTPEGRSRGFAIVAMDDAAAAEAATALDQIELGGRRISVRRFNTEPRE